MQDCFTFLLHACLVHFLFYLHALSLTSLPNHIYCSEDILECFFNIKISWLPESQCDILLHVVLRVYQCSVCQKPFWAASYKNGPCANLGWLNSCTHLFTTLSQLLPLKIWQCIFCGQKLWFSSHLSEGIFSVSMIFKQSTRFVSYISISGFVVNMAFQYSTVRSQNFTIQMPDSHFESLVNRECTLMYTRSLAFNLSDLIMEWSVSHFCLLIEIFFFANTRPYLIDLRSRRPFSSPWYLMLAKSSFLRGIRGSLSKSRKMASL